MTRPQWINFLAMLGSGVLTFLAGAEINPQSLRANIRASLTIGVFSFALPFAGVWIFAQYVLGWGWPQAQIAGIALSTTSYKKILVGYDGSAGANTALRHAVFLARDLGSEVWALWVKGSLPHYPEMGVWR